jgi:hypothetical protein
MQQGTDNKKQYGIKLWDKTSPCGCAWYTKYGKVPSQKGQDCVLGVFGAKELVDEEPLFETEDLVDRLEDSLGD